MEAQGYEVHCAEDGFEGLASLKQALPELIISDLRMPNMNGFEFLSVVRRRFPMIPVIVISGEYSGGSVPESVLADAFFPKGGLRPEELFEKIIDLIHELPTRPKTGKSNNAAVWVKNDKGTIAVTCSDCLRTFPVSKCEAVSNEAECDSAQRSSDLSSSGTITWPTENQFSQPFESRIQCACCGDPRFGIGSYELTNVSRNAPDPSLFKLPDGFSKRSRHCCLYFLSAGPINDETGSDLSEAPEAPSGDP